MMHFSHPHELHHIEVPRENRQTTCSGCELYLFGSCYTCSACNYFLHRSCFELPQATSHKAHPQHTLGLLYPPYCSGTCDACGGSCDGFTYSCSLCNFNLHACCVRLDQAVARDDHEQYFLTFLKQILAEQKSLVAQLAPLAAQFQGNNNASSRPQQMQNDWDFQRRQNEQELQRRQNEQELQRRRIQMYNQQMKFSMDSINRMGGIG